MAGLLDTLVSPFPTAGAIRNKFRKNAWSSDLDLGKIDSNALRGKFAFFCGMVVSLNYLMAHRKKITAAPFSKTDFIDPSGLRETYVQRFYYDLLKENHKKLGLSWEEFRKQIYKIVPGKGSQVKIPDLLTSDAADQVFEYYELKPDNSGGKSDANAKLEVIREFMDRNNLTIYTRGQKYNGCTVPICNFSFLDLGVVHATLTCRRDGMGVLLYKVRIEADVDIAPALEKALAGAIALAAIEAGAFFAATEGAGVASSAASAAMQTFVRVAEPTYRIAISGAAAAPAVEPTLAFVEETVAPQVRRMVLEIPKMIKGR